MSKRPRHSKFADYSSMKVGRLTLLDKVGDIGFTYRCKCDCGAIVLKQIEARHMGGTSRFVHCGKSCPLKISRGAPPIEKAKAAYCFTKFGRLYILDIFPKQCGKHKFFFAKTQCDCGREKEIRLNNILQGATTSCGCVHIEKTRAALSQSRKWYVLTESGKIYCDSGFEVIYYNWLLATHQPFDFHKHTLSVPSGGTYTPDFYLPEQSLFVEVKGHEWDGAQAKKRQELRDQGYNIKDVFIDDLSVICQLPCSVNQCYERAYRSGKDKYEFFAKSMYLLPTKSASTDSDALVALNEI